jgi:hypothetical protein
VTYRSIARQRLGKFIPAEDGTRAMIGRPWLGNGSVNSLLNNREAVFSTWSVPMVYQGTNDVVRVSCRELGRVLEMAVEGD